MFAEIIDESNVPVSCPRCEYVVDVTVREARLESALICPGCRVTIQFIEDGMTRTGLRQVEEAERELQRQLEAINRSGLLRITMRRG